MSKRIEVTKEDKEAYIKKIHDVMERKKCSAVIAAKELRVNKMRYYQYKKELYGKEPRGTKTKVPTKSRPKGNKKPQVITMEIPSPTPTHIAVMDIATYRALYL